MKIKLKKEFSVLVGDHHGLIIPAGTIGSIIDGNVTQCSATPSYFVFDLLGFKVFVKSRERDDQPVYEELENESNTGTILSNEAVWQRARDEHYAKLKPYQIPGVAICPKCQSGNISARYRKMSSFGSVLSHDPILNKLFTDSCYDIIDRQCPTCCYSWQEIPLDACKKSLEPPSCAVWSLEEAKRFFENGADYVYCTWAEAQRFKKVKSVKEAIEFYSDQKTKAEPNCAAVWTLDGAYDAFGKGLAGVFCLKRDRYHLARSISEAHLFFNNSQD
jgi:hypothetical protein